MKTNKTKPIPEDVFDKILYHAVHDEKDVLTKAGIIIQSQTGLRINEVLSIQEGCVKRTSDGYDYMEVTLGKTEKGEPIIHKVFINDLVKDAITELSEYTSELRKESGLKELFLCKSAKKKNAINVYSLEHWNDQKLSPFINKYDIRDNKGELYPLTSHQFRATFVRELIKRKVPIAMIMKQYSHVSIEMTAHYLTLQEEEVKEIYSDMILSPESKIAGLRAKEIKGKLDDLFHGKTETEIDNVITDLAKTMSFNPLPTGVCLYDFRRGNCTDGDGCFFYNCPNYITEVQFYPILKDELDLLEKEMARLKELGQEPAYQVQAVKYKYLKPLVESLEVQLNVHYMGAIVDKNQMVRCEYKDSICWVPNHIFARVVLETKIPEKFVRYKTGADLYDMSERQFRDLAKEADAIYKKNRMVLVDLRKIDDYLEYFHVT